MMNAEWISVKERLPDECVAVLLTDGNEQLVGSLQRSLCHGKQYRWAAAGVGGYEWEWSFDDTEIVTHWMPLPEPPAVINRGDA